MPYGESGAAVSTILEDIKGSHKLLLDESAPSFAEKAKIIATLIAKKHLVEERYDVNQGGGSVPNRAF